MAGLSSPPLKRARPRFKRSPGMLGLSARASAIKGNRFFVVFLACLRKGNRVCRLGSGSFRGWVLRDSRHAVSASAIFPCCSIGKRDLALVCPPQVCVLPRTVRPGSVPFPARLPDSVHCHRPQLLIRIANHDSVRSFIFDWRPGGKLVQDKEKEGRGRDCLPRPG